VPARLESTSSYVLEPKVVRDKKGQLAILTDLIKQKTRVTATGEPRLDTLNDIAKDIREKNPNATIRKNYVTNHNTTAAH